MNDKQKALLVVITIFILLFLSICVVILSRISKRSKALNKPENKKLDIEQRLAQEIESIEKEVSERKKMIKDGVKLDFNSCLLKDDLNRFKEIFEEEGGSLDTIAKWESDKFPKWESDKFNNVPFLHVLVKKSSKNIIGYILNKFGDKIDVNKIYRGDNALLHAIQNIKAPKDFIEITDLLVNRGLDINARAIPSTYNYGTENLIDLLFNGKKTVEGTGVEFPVRNVASELLKRGVEFLSKKKDVSVFYTLLKYDDNELPRVATSVGLWPFSDMLRPAMEQRNSHGNGIVLLEFLKYPPPNHPANKFYKGKEYIDLISLVLANNPDLTVINEDGKTASELVNELINNVKNTPEDMELFSKVLELIENYKNIKNQSSSIMRDTAVEKTASNENQI